MEFVKEKLKEYKVDEIEHISENEEQFVYMNPDLPLRYCNDISVTGQASPSGREDKHH